MPLDMVAMLAQGVKIYSYRVDSVHSEVYKVLGGLSRTEKPRGEGAEDDRGGARCQNPGVALRTPPRGKSCPARSCT